MTEERVWRLLPSSSSFFGSRGLDPPCVSPRSASMRRPNPVKANVGWPVALSPPRLGICPASIRTLHESLTRCPLGYVCPGAAIS